MSVRVLFVLQRFVVYGAVFFIVGGHGHRPWWQWLVGIAVWTYGTLELWKHPDENAAAMRLGIWIEVLAIVLWSVCVHNGLIMILLLSPVARAGVHLGWRDALLLVICSTVAIVSAWRLLSTERWIAVLEVGGMLGTCGYSLTLGELLRHKERLKRAAQLTAFEREQHIKDEERLRMAGRLHDTLGQYWTAVIRALDVAEQVTGELHHLFLSKARDAAIDGLSAMRQTTHHWSNGRQSPREWLQFAEESLVRLRNAVDVEIRFQFAEIDWSRFEHRASVAELVARTLIEGTSNAIRHSGAKCILINLRSDANEVRAEVRDDGSAMKEEHKTKMDHGTGIATLQNAAREVGGSLHLASVPDNGAVLLLRVPYTGSARS